jgi:catechol 2,3-dioxygenase
MGLPLVNTSPPFDITRLSHVVLNVRDLTKSIQFYEGVIGLIVTNMSHDRVYMRGVEERCHHSLVLCRDDGGASCRTVGFRVRGDAQLDLARSYFDDNGMPSEWCDAANQGRTLRVFDDGGVPLELCSEMPLVERQALRFNSIKGAAATGIDHIQAHVADLTTAAAFYGRLGFRISEFASADGTPDTPMRSIFLARKGNANDIVLLANEGPRLHHFSYVVHDASTTLLRVCDILASMEMRGCIEWGPGRHGLGCEQFLYIRDPDGHRVELLSPPYQFIDPEEPPFGWATVSPDVANTWGPPAPETWRHEATHFAGIQTQMPDVPAAAVSAAAEQPH